MKPRLTIFKNKKAGQPILKNGEPLEYNGKPMLECDLSGKINLPEGLEAGDYEVAIYKQVSQKGLSYYGGTIKPAFKKKSEAGEKHYAAKSNGYQPQEDIDDSIPY